MKVNSVLFFVTTHTLVCKDGAAVVYNGAWQGLDTLPGDIPEDVETIHLQKNNFVSIDSFPFFPNVTRIDLQENQLEAFPNLTNVSLTLYRLDLKKNKISYVDPDILGSLTALGMLYLQDNHLEYFPDATAGTGPFSLVLLYLASNYLAEFPVLSLLGENLTNLVVSGNLIKVIGDEHLVHLPKLVFFSADSNPVGYIPNFEHMKSTLFSVSMMQCGICEVNADILQPLEKLSYLNLDMNMLEAVPDFSKSPSKATMQHLFLNYNPISHIQLSRLYGMPNLNYILLMGNNLQGLPNWCRLTKLPTYLAVPGNSFPCDRRLRWTIRANSAGMGMLYDYIFYPCTIPESLAGLLWAGIQEDDLGDSGEDSRSEFIPKSVTSLCCILCINIYITKHR